MNKKNNPESSNNKTNAKSVAKIRKERSHNTKPIVLHWEHYLVFKLIVLCEREQKPANLRNAKRFL